MIEYREFIWEIPNREKFYIRIHLAPEHIISELKVEGFGDLRFLHVLNELRKVTGIKLVNFQPEKFCDSNGVQPNHIVRRVMKLAFNQISDPKDLKLNDKLCFCRSISYKSVIDGVLVGATKLEDIRRMTSANTSCGTCIADVEYCLNLFL